MGGLAIIVSRMWGWDWISDLAIIVSRMLGWMVFTLSVLLEKVCFYIGTIFAGHYSLKMRFSTASENFLLSEQF